MDWDLPAIVLDTRPYGEGDVIVTVMTEAHGAHRGLARGGAHAAQGGLWQAGNFVQARWIARLSDQLGQFPRRTDPRRRGAVMDDPLALAMLTVVCALAEDALPEREPHEAVFAGLISLLPRLTLGEARLPRSDPVGDDPALRPGIWAGPFACAVTGATEGLAYVSPKTGRAVTAEGAGIWSNRLLRLPLHARRGGTGRDVAGPEHERIPSVRRLARRAASDGPFPGAGRIRPRHRPLPMARQMLYDRVAAMADSTEATRRSRITGPRCRMISPDTSKTPR